MNDRETYRRQLAAYFAGQLSADAAAALESALSRDETLAREARALRPVAAELACASTAEASDFRLSPDRLALIRAAASGHIVEFPGARPARAEHTRVFTLRRFAPALAAAAAVIIGAVTGFDSGRERFDSAEQSWQVATRQDAASSLRPEADLVHYYPPAYGLDHHVPQSGRRPIAVGFAAPAPLYYGLPGPRPAYLIRGETLLLQ